MEDTDDYDKQISEYFKEIEELNEEIKALKLEIEAVDPDIDLVQITIITIILEIEGLIHLLGLQAGQELDLIHLVEELLILLLILLED